MEAAIPAAAAAGPPVPPAGVPPAGPEVPHLPAAAAEHVEGQAGSEAAETSAAAGPAPPGAAKTAAAGDAVQPFPREALSRTWSSSQRPPPSPFEGVPLNGTPAARPPLPPRAPSPAEAAAAVAQGAAAGPTNGPRSPRPLHPTKSALKIKQDGEQPAAAPTSMDAQQSKGLSWADTHGQVRRPVWVDVSVFSGTLV